MPRALRLSIAATVLAVSLAAAPALANKYRVIPRGKLLVPKRLFDREHKALDQRVLAANPRIYLYPDFDPQADHILVIGMPGWGGRSEKFIWSLINGLKDKTLTRRLIVASIQDLNSGGPQYQGQGDRAHANVWGLQSAAIAAMRHFILRMAFQFGKLRVYMMGFSSGGVMAPRLAIRVARLAGNEPYRVEGSIALGTGSAVRAESLIKQKQRALFIVVPELKRSDKKPMRDDQHNRRTAERHFDRLVAQGADVHLRYIFSAKRHLDWHWGLLSQCRYFRYSRIDPGRGYWPNYWIPNPETYEAIVPFIKGQAPPESLNRSRASKCPY